jgi:hypothetical protein
MKRWPPAIHAENRGLSPVSYSDPVGIVLKSKFIGDTLTFKIAKLAAKKKQI